MGCYLERYVYDTVGNFLEMQHQGSDSAHSGWTRTYAYNEPSLLEPGKQSNRLTSTTIGATTESYSTAGDGYDAHGNMLRMPHLQTMQWNFNDQLQMTQRQAVNAADADGVQRHGERSWYVYDSAGQRVRKVTERANGQVKDERIYLGGFEIYRKNGANPLVRETLHIMDDKQRIALVETRVQGNEPGVPRQLIRYQFGNHLGSASLELDDQARIISYEEYAPYGSTSYQAVRSQTETPKRYQYTGKERDEESGLYYHGARYYAPWIGTWCSPDPLFEYSGAPSDTQFFPSPYIYADNMPIVGTDPSGRSVVVQGFDGSITVERGGRTRRIRLNVTQREAVDMFRRDFEAGLSSAERAYFTVDPSSGQLQLTQAYHQAVAAGGLSLSGNAQRLVEAIGSQRQTVIRPLSVFSHPLIRTGDLVVLGPNAHGVEIQLRVQDTRTGQRSTRVQRFGVSGALGASGAQGITLLERSLAEGLQPQPRYSASAGSSEVYYLSHLYDPRQFRMRPDVARVVARSISPDRNPTPQEVQRHVSKILYHEVAGHVVEALRGRASPHLPASRLEEFRRLGIRPPGFDGTLQDIEAEVEANVRQWNP